MPHILRTEQALWDYIRPLLYGRRWTRLENSVGSGAGDAFGFFSGETHWLELKVGKPGINKLRPSQHDFIIECTRADVPVWCCFAHRGEVKFFRGLDFDQPVWPEFYLPVRRMLTIPPVPGGSRRAHSDR